MAIEKNNFKVSRLDLDLSMGSRSRKSMSSDDDDELHRASPMDSEDDDEFEEADSGAGSDDFDMRELGEESGLEYCQVGDQTCCLPFELYDLPDLGEVLSLDVWNECLTEEERFSLTQYLPDMDQETYMHTLKDLFDGGNFHFGSPVAKLFEMLKGGLCEPRVALYRQGLSFFQRHQHYHVVRNHENSMVSNLLQIKDAWKSCKGYSIDEKLRVLNIVRKGLRGEKIDLMQSDSSEQEESVEGRWGKRSKVRSSVEKAGYDLARGINPSSDYLSRGRSLAMGSSKRSKQNPKGVLKLVGSKAPMQKDLFVDVHPRSQGHQGLKSTPFGPGSQFSRHGKASGYDSRAPAWQMRDQLEFDDEDEEVAYGMDHEGDWNPPGIGRNGFAKKGKKRRVARGDEYIGESYIDKPIPSRSNFSAYGVDLNVNQLSDIKVLTAEPSNMRTSYERGKKGKYLELAYDDQMTSRRASSKANHADSLNRSQPFFGKKTKREVELPDPNLIYDDWDVGAQKSKLGKGFSDTKLKTARISQQQMDRKLFPSKRQVKPVMEKTRGIPMKERGPTIASFRTGTVLSRGEETESDSSDYFNEVEDNNPLMLSKLALPSGGLESSRSSGPQYGLNHEKDKKAKKGKKQSAQIIDEVPANRRFVGDFDGHLQLPDGGNFVSKSRQKAKMQQFDHFESFIPQVSETSHFNGLRKSKADQKKKASKKNSKNGQMRAAAGQNSPLPERNVSPAGRESKGALGKDFSPVQANFLKDYYAEEDGDLFEAGQFEHSAQNGETTAGDRDSRLIGCSSVDRKRKLKNRSADVDEYSDYMDSTSKHFLDEPPPARKRVKKKVEADIGALDLEKSPPLTEIPVTEVEPEPKPPKKFILITPTVHADFSFSVVHLLSAVRVALVTPKPEDCSEVEKPPENTDNSEKIVEDQSRNGSHENLDVKNPECSGQMNTPLLSVQEIVNRVRSDPGDPSILDMQEPLDDLIRGVLKIFSSRTAPLGAKGWKPLVCYEKSRKSWSWIGPMPESSSDQNASETVVSPEGWGIPHKMLVKLVDAFATWLKSGQETLQQIGSLPAPPLELMQMNLDEKERFRDLRAQKSLSTINPSSEEVRAYFRKEEHLRYSVPDRAFSYTAADGKKSIVAPLRRGGGKPTSKARDHPMLKRDRPPHVTILCLVRDAAARLPGSIGTRADVCTLIRDSQYIVEETPDSQVNQVVSGALDRLHYERDPCVQFDGERKLWVYLHREREEEDFEDDGTSSTKKWKRPKKEATEQSDQGTSTVAGPASKEQGGFDLSSDLNAELPCADDENKRVEILNDDTRQNPDDNVENSELPEQGGIDHSHPIMWEGLGLDTMPGSKLLCPENSVHEDFDDGTFAAEGQIGASTCQL